MNRPEEPLLLRRNGRPAACDPCRARKVACDHTRPVCNRCRKRKQANQCSYPDSGISGSASSRAHVSVRGIAPVPGVAEPNPPESTVASPEPIGPGRPGYLGNTSFSNVFEETQSCLALLSGTSALTSQSNREAAQSQRGISFHELPLPLRETCLLVLRCLPGQVNEQIVFTEPSQTPSGWTHILVARIAQSLQDEYGSMLASGEPGLEAMAELLCKNTAQPIRDFHDDSQTWLSQFCGQNLRWESLGLVWVHAIGISDVVDALRYRSLQYKDGKDSLETARALLVYCIEVARHFSEANDLLVDLCRRRSTICSMIEGDARITAYSAHATAVSMLTYLGLHALENDSSYVPSLCSENKRRLAAQLFTSDKTGVAFAGRPPLLSQRYWLSSLPLDISDEELASDPATLMKASQSLDGNGWNTRNVLNSATLIRARFLLAVHREEVLEIALGRSPSNLDPAHLINIKVRQQATLETFPSSLQYHPDNLSDPDLATDQLYLRILVRLEKLWTDFFLDRLLLKQRQVDEGHLLVTSFEMVSLTLKIWTHKDKFSSRSMRRNFEWLVMSKGAPGGGILCQELLYPSFTGVHPLDPNLTRSSIVQQLSLLVGFLDWVRPSAPNGDICADSKAVIQQVLDHHLNGLAQGDGVFQNTDLGLMAQPDFNFQLLDTFEWLKAYGQ